MNHKADTLFHMISVHNNLSPSGEKVFKELMKFLDKDGIININFYHKKCIANDAGVVPQTVNNIILQLKKIGLIRSVDIGSFRLSKSIFVDGYFNGLYARTEWKNINYTMSLNSDGLLQVRGTV